MNKQIMNSTNENTSFDIAVCGAHLEGLPLNFQLTDLDAVLKSKTNTTPHYEMYVLANQSIDKPGMFWVEKGESLEVEVWTLPQKNVGAFLAQIKHPLGLGEIELIDGTWVHGFVCNSIVAKAGKNISHLGGWRNYLATK